MKTKEIAGLRALKVAQNAERESLQHKLALKKEELVAVNKTLKAEDKAANVTKKSTRATREHTAAVKKGTAARNASGNELVRHIRRLESLVVGFYAVKRAYDATMGAGHEFNKLIERETIGLKLLISQNLALHDSKGKLLTVTERYNLAQQEANKAIKIAREVKDDL